MDVVSVVVARAAVTAVIIAIIFVAESVVVIQSKERVGMQKVTGRRSSRRVLTIVAVILVRLEVE